VIEFGAGLARAPRGFLGLRVLGVRRPAQNRSSLVVSAAEFFQ
jgi:hypothetical protein